MRVGPDRHAGVQASMSTPSSDTAWSRASATESPLPARGSPWAAMSGCCCSTLTASAARPARRAWAAEWARSWCRRQDQVTLRVRLPPCVSSALMSPHSITFHIAGGLAPGIRLFSTIHCLMKHLPGGCCRMQGHHKLSVKLLLQRLSDIEGRALH